MTTLEALTAAAKDALPGQDARIDKGAALVAAHAVWPLTSGSFFSRRYRRRTPSLPTWCSGPTTSATATAGMGGRVSEIKISRIAAACVATSAASMLTVRMGTAYTAKY